MFIIKFTKTGGELEIKSSEFKIDEGTGLPIANLGYGLDVSYPISKNNPEVMFYPNVIGKGKTSVNYRLPYCRYRPEGIDTKTGRVFKIEKIETDRNPIKDSLFPIFKVVHDNKIVALLRGEEYNKD